MTKFQALITLLPVTALLALASCRHPQGGVSFAREKLVFQAVTDHGGDGQIRLKSGKDGISLFVHATVGSRQGWLQVDTGAPLSLLAADICDSNQYDEVSRGHLSTPGGNMTASIGTIFSMRIDQIEIFAPVVIRQENISYFNSISPPCGRGKVIGVLGLQTLNLMDATIHVRNQMISIGPNAGRMR